MILGKAVASHGCLEVIGDSRISQNVMPWFKQGAHDRIFNSMLNGAVCLSDDSPWLRENLEDGKEIVYYSLSKIEELPSIVDGLLTNPNLLEEIVLSGYEKAKVFHTWEHRARVLEGLFDKFE